MDHTSAKTDMLEHSQSKIDLYSNYLSIFFSIMKYIPYIDQIYIFDLFAGEGIYENGSEGSPLTACRVIKNHYFSNNETCPNITLWLNDNGVSRIEPGIQKIERVERFIQEIFLPDNITLKYFDEDYDNLWPRALEEVKNRNNVKALFFIDPYGYKDIDPDDLREIMGAGNTEILLFIPAFPMYRFAAKASTSDFPGGAPLKKLLFKIYGDDVPLFSSVHDFINGFSYQLTKYMGEEIFNVKYIIERDSTNVYCLLFFTSNALGCQKMLEAKWKQDPTTGTGHRVEKTIPLFGGMELENYPEEVLKYISGADHRTNHELYRFGLNQGFLPKHTNYVLNNYLKTETITKFSLDEKQTRGNYIKYRHDRIIGFRCSPDILK